MKYTISFPRLSNATTSRYHRTKRKHLGDTTRWQNIKYRNESWKRFAAPFETSFQLPRRRNRPVWGLLVGWWADSPVSHLDALARSYARSPTPGKNTGRKRRIGKESKRRQGRAWKDSQQTVVPIPVQRLNSSKKTLMHGWFTRNRWRILTSPLIRIRLHVSIAWLHESTRCSSLGMKLVRHRDW